MRLAVLTKGSFRAIDCTHSTQEDVYLLDALPTMECWNLDDIWTPFWRTAMASIFFLVLYVIMIPIWVSPRTIWVSQGLISCSLSDRRLLFL